MLESAISDHEDLRMYKFNLRNSRYLSSLDSRAYVIVMPSRISRRTITNELVLIDAKLLISNTHLINYRGQSNGGSEKATDTIQLVGTCTESDIQRVRERETRFIVYKSYNEVINEWIDISRLSHKMAIRSGYYLSRSVNLNFR